MAKEDEWDWAVDFFDSRDLEERIDYIQRELEIDDEAREETPSEPYLDDDERQSLIDEQAQLKAFASELAGYVPDWRYGSIVVAEDHFEDYARQLAEELGLINADAGWPARNIDWAAAADELKMDYSSAEDPNGNTWWAR
jgi:hypothetical protein